MKLKNMLIVVGISFLLVGCQEKTFENQSSEEVDHNTKVKRQISVEIEPTEETKEDTVLAYVETMTLEEKVGQLFMVALPQSSVGESVEKVNEEVVELLETYHVGGIILFEENLKAPDQVQSLITDLQHYSKVPLWVGVDEEGGRVSRLGKNPAFSEKPFLPALEFDGDETYAYEEAKRMGHLLQVLGFNMNFAPVADIYNNPQNTVIGDRSYGTTSEEVVPMVLAVTKGLEEQGIVPVIKHFPGHGNTSQDSHETLAYIEKSLEEIKNEEWVPFEKSIEKGVDAVMLGHLIVEDVDPNTPVSLSSVWGEMLTDQYENVLWITDAMNMGAITLYYTPEESALRFIESGYDVFLMPQDLERSYDAIYEGVLNGNLSEKELTENVIKILSKKVTQNIMSLE